MGIAICEAMVHKVENTAVDPMKKLIVRYFVVQ